MVGVHRVGDGVWQEASGLTVLRSEIRAVDVGVRIGADATVADSLIEDTGSLGIADDFGGERVVIRHNTIRRPDAAGSAIALSGSPYVDVIIENNLIAGGGYAMYLPAEPGSRNIYVTGNRFSREYFPDCGRYGVVSSWGAATDSSWHDNVWHETGARISF